MPLIRTTGWLAGLHVQLTRLGLAEQGGWPGLLQQGFLELKREGQGGGWGPVQAEGRGGGTEWSMGSQALEGGLEGLCSRMDCE